MVDLAAASAALFVALLLPGTALGPGTDRLANDCRLEAAGDAGRYRALQPASFSARYLLCAVAAAAVLCVTFGRQHDRSREGSPHLRASLAHGFAELRDRAWQAA